MQHLAADGIEATQATLVSACLVGIACTWDASELNRNERVLALLAKRNIVPVCPEQLGGLSTPRPRQEILNGQGVDVLEGRAQVKNSEGQDVTMQFVKGAHETLKLGRLLRACCFIGKARSPSCGSGEIYDGSFAGRTIDGDGVTAALLKRNGIEVVTEEGLLTGDSR